MLSLAQKGGRAMDSIELIGRNGEEVRKAIEMGEIIHLDTAGEELTDEFILFAINSGLLEKWAEGFPDPRAQAEIGMEVIIASSIAARFAGLYSIRKMGYVLKSAIVLGALGYSINVVEPGEGISKRGTTDEKIISGDVLRKLLVQMEEKVEIKAELKPIKEPEVKVKVRDRASRREVKGEVNELEAQARATEVVRELLDWYNQTVGLSMLQYAELGKGRRIHILDATKIEVTLESDNYECSGLVRNDDGSISRGYKLGTLRTLLDKAGILTQVALASIQVHDLELCRSILIDSQAIREGDLILEDRGFLDGANISYLKKERKVDVIVPLKSNMLACQEAIKLAQLQGNWQAHPSRSNQEIAFVAQLPAVWDSCTVGLNACVIRFWNDKKKIQDYIVLVTTDLKFSAALIVRHYEERPEVEQDYQQLKSGGWLLNKLSTTRYSEIGFYILTIVLSYSLYHLFADTMAGARFANKTRQALALEQLRTRRTHIIVYAGGFFEIFETLHFCQLLLHLPIAIQLRIRCWLDEQLGQIEDPLKGKNDSS
jgi:hypothetical protein